jgi:RNA polymerase sigma-70 factor (ECF subfamily)
VTSDPAGAVDPDVHAVTLDAPAQTTDDAPGRSAAVSFASAAETYLDDVYGYLLYLTKERSLAEDLTNETFETALRRWRKFDPVRGTARTWLLAIARSTALDRFRADSRRRRREERAHAAEPRAAADEAFEGFSPQLENALRALSAGEREVLALRVVLELDGDEAARLLGLTPTAVSTRLHRALGKLEERMRNDDV